MKRKSTGKSRLVLSSEKRFFNIIQNDVMHKLSQTFVLIICTENNVFFSSSNTFFSSLYFENLEIYILSRYFFFGQFLMISENETFIEYFLLTNTKNKISTLLIFHHI
jgi:hypothetical protein